MDGSTAAVVIDFCPWALRTMWTATALNRAEARLNREKPEVYEAILDDAADYGVAIEYDARGSEVGQYGYDTSYQLLPAVDDEIIEHDNTDIDPDIARTLAETWVDEIIDVVAEAQEATPLSAKQFATLITRNDPNCSEKEAADAMGISVGNYRGKMGDVREKQDRCKEGEILDRLSKQHVSGYKSLDRGLGDREGHGELVKPSDLLEARIEGREYFWEQIRESVEERTHDTYEQAHWRTAHIEGVDNLFVASTAEGDHDDFARLDIDGVGHPGADLHREGENIQASVWLNTANAIKLYRDLGEMLEQTGIFDQETVTDSDALGEWVTEHAEPGHRVRLVDHDASLIDATPQANFEGQ